MIQSIITVTTVLHNTVVLGLMYHLVPILIVNIQTHSQTLIQFMTELFPN